MYYTRIPAMPLPRSTKKKTYRPRTTLAGRKLNYRQKRQVKRLIGNRTETKYHDFVVNSSITAGGGVSAMVAPAQGIKDTERVGDSIQLKKLVYNLAFSGADTTNIIRFIIVRWSLNSATSSPTVTDILETATPTALYNYDQYNQGKFHVVFDRSFACTAVGWNLYVARGAIWGKKLGRKKMQFNEAATSGLWQFFWLAITDSVAASHPTIVGDMRLEYTDA